MVVVGGAHLACGACWLRAWEEEGLMQQVCPSLRLVFCFLLDDKKVWLLSNKQPQEWRCKIFWCFSNEEEAVAVNKQ